MQVYPWHSALFQTLQDAFAANCLGHALLFEGQEGMGKVDLAFALAHTVLSRDTKQTALLDPINAHPDLYILQAPEGKSTIAISFNLHLFPYSLLVFDPYGIRPALLGVPKRTCHNV